VQRLGPPKNSRQSLYRGADDINFGLLCGQGRPAGLGMKPQRLGTGIPGPEPVLHGPGPHPARRAEFCYFLEELIVGIEKEGETRRKLINLEAPVPGCFNVGNGISESECNLLRSCGPGFAYVVTRNRNCIPARKLASRICEYVSHYPEAWTRWINVGSSGNVFLQDVILDRA